MLAELCRDLKKSLVEPQWKLRGKLSVEPGGMLEEPLGNLEEVMKDLRKTLEEPYGNLREC